MVTSEPAIVVAFKPAPSVPMKIAKLLMSSSDGSSSETESSVNAIEAQVNPA